MMLKASTALRTNLPSELLASLLHFLRFAGEYEDLCRHARPTLHLCASSYLCVLRSFRRINRASLRPPLRTVIALTFPSSSISISVSLLPPLYTDTLYTPLSLDSLGQSVFVRDTALAIHALPTISRISLGTVKPVSTAGGHTKVPPSLVNDTFLYDFTSSSRALMS